MTSPLLVQRLKSFSNLSKRVSQVTAQTLFCGGKQAAATYRSSFRPKYPLSHFIQMVCFSSLDFCLDMPLCKFSFQGRIMPPEPLFAFFDCLRFALKCLKFGSEKFSLCLSHDSCMAHISVLLIKSLHSGQVIFVVKEP